MGYTYIFNGFFYPVYSCAAIAVSCEHEGEKKLELLFDCSGLRNSRPVGLIIPGMIRHLRVEGGKALFTFQVITFFSHVGFGLYSS